MPLLGTEEQNTQINATYDYSSIIPENQYPPAGNNGDILPYSKNSAADDNIGEISTEVKNNICYEDKKADMIPINGLIPERDLVIKTPAGEVITRGYDQI